MISIIKDLPINCCRLGAESCGLWNGRERDIVIETQFEHARALKGDRIADVVGRLQTRHNHRLGATFTRPVVDIHRLIRATTSRKLDGCVVTCVLLEAAILA